MSEPIWNDFLTERDKQVIGKAGWGQRAGFGVRPVVMVVDVNYDFTGDRPEPILESIVRWSNSCGEEAWSAMRAIQKLLSCARAKGLPVIYSTGTARADGWDVLAWMRKNKRLLASPPVADRPAIDGNEINAQIAPEPQDIVIRKLKPSAFHGTPLNSFLTQFRADSLLVVGTTTSGCVRATVVDAFSENYRVTLVEEGCFDRSQASHAMSLCDMSAKYADVVCIDRVVEYIDGLPEGLFELPSGATK